MFESWKPFTGTELILLVVAALNSEQISRRLFLEKLCFTQLRREIVVVICARKRHLRVVNTCIRWIKMKRTDVTFCSMRIIRQIVLNESLNNCIETLNRCIYVECENGMNRETN